MAVVGNIMKYSNESAIASLQPSLSTNLNPSAGTEYNAATVSGIVFGIFMALLALYSIWQYNKQHIEFMHLLLLQNRQIASQPENLDVEIRTLNSTTSDQELNLVNRQDADEV